MIIYITKASAFAYIVIDVSYHEGLWCTFTFRNTGAGKQKHTLCMHRLKSHMYTTILSSLSSVPEKKVKTVNCILINYTQYIAMNLTTIPVTRRQLLQQLKGDNA